MHTPFLPLCLVAFCILYRCNSLPASVVNPPTITQELALSNDGSNITIPFLIPQLNHTHNLTSLTGPPFTYTDKVSNTEMTLYIHYTSWLSHTTAIAKLLHATSIVVDLQAYTRGTKARLISNSNGAQSFRNSMPGGLQIRVQNLIPFALEWGDMRDLMRGLQEWCSYFTCRFQFSVGSEGLRIGEGEIF